MMKAELARTEACSNNAKVQKIINNLSRAITYAVSKGQFTTAGVFTLHETDSCEKYIERYFTELGYYCRCRTTENGDKDFIINWW